uniref:4Fe-4S ferredoxin-type domain-containing protein n=1 Tax=Trichuris muris TaxID=70415 RepID=A0A5S6QIT1_TRIMR
MNVPILCFIVTVFWCSSCAAIYQDSYPLISNCGTTPLTYCHLCNPCDTCCLQTCIPCTSCQFKHVRCSMCQPWDFTCLSSCIPGDLPCITTTAQPPVTTAPAVRCCHLCPKWDLICLRLCIKCP